MLADRLEEWASAYKAEGELKGRQEGEALALQKLLAKRFGVIPVDITAKMANASLANIDCWLDRVLDAKQLSDVFVDITI